MTKFNESFNREAKLYFEGRLSYPDNVIDWITEKTNVSKEDTLLEIGAGTGQATIPFAKRGFSVHCIELGKNLADLIVQQTGDYNVTVDISSFENWEPPNAFSTSFIFSATAFHWVDINTKYKKCHSLLSDGGYLVLIWNNDEPSAKNPIIKEAYKRLFNYYPGQNLKIWNVDDLNIGRRKEILESGLFELVGFLQYKWFPIQKRETLIKGFFSKSSFLTLTQKQQKELTHEINDLFSGLDDEIETEIHTSVFVAKKQSIRANTR